MESPYGVMRINGTPRTSSPTRLMLFFGWMCKIVRVVRELNAKADDQWSSLQGYADKRDAEDGDPYKVDVVFSDGCAKS